jgi:hypothetical protein
MAAEFQSANAWAAGMTVAQLIEQFLTITKDDYLAYSEAQRTLIRDITRLGHTADEAAESLGEAADAADDMAGFSGVYGLTPDQLARNRAIEEANKLAEAFAAARQNIWDYLRDLGLSQHSPLDPAQQLRLVVDQFYQMFAGAMGGDLGALQGLPGLADILLDLARQNYATGPEFQALYEWVRRLLGEAGTLPGAGAAADFNTKVLDQGDRQITLAEGTLSMLLTIRDRGDANAAQVTQAVNNVASAVREAVVDPR